MRYLKVMTITVATTTLPRDCRGIDLLKPTALTNTSPNAINSKQREPADQVEAHAAHKEAGQDHAAYSEVDFSIEGTPGAPSEFQERRDHSTQRQAAQDERISQPRNLRTNVEKWPPVAVCRRRRELIGHQGDLRAPGPTLATSGG